MEIFAGNLLPEAEAAASELDKRMAENMKASIDMCVAATADVAIGELAEQMAYEAPSQYAGWATPESSNMLTTYDATPILPEDEINVVKAEEVGRIINSVEDHLLAQGQELVQQSMSTLKELTNNPEVQKALESEGLTVDYAKVNQVWEGVSVEDTMVQLRPLTADENIMAEDVTCDCATCACTDCVESTDTAVDTDTDTMLIVHDLSERLTALEQRIAAFNTKSSHKI